MRILAAALLSAACLACGCSLTPKPKADPTQFFVLEARPVRAEASRRRPKVELEPVEVPAYLSNSRLAARTGSNRIDYAEFRRWAEPLPDGIARALREDLSPVADIEAAPVGGKKPACRLKVRVRSFEGLRAPSGDSAILFEASWELQPGGRGEFSAPSAAWDGRDYGRLAGLLSDALADLSENLARELRKD